METIVSPLQKRCNSTGALRAPGNLLPVAETERIPGVLRPPGKYALPDMESYGINIAPQEIHAHVSFLAGRASPDRDKVSYLQK